MSVGGPDESRDLSGEQRLMLAVLQDAIRCSLKIPAGRRLPPHGPATEARRWIESADMQWPFSFERICEALGLDATRVRATVLASGGTSSAEQPQPALLISKLRREGHRHRRTFVPVRRVA